MWKMGLSFIQMGRWSLENKSVKILGECVIHRIFSKYWLITTVPCACLALRLNTLVSKLFFFFFFCQKEMDLFHLFFCSPEYDRLLFTMIDRLQKLNLDENERNLLKLVGFFDNGKFSEDRHLLSKQNCNRIGNIFGQSWVWSRHLGTEIYHPGIEISLVCSQ